PVGDARGEYELDAAGGQAAGVEAGRVGEVGLDGQAVEHGHAAPVIAPHRPAATEVEPRPGRTVRRAVFQGVAGRAAERVDVGRADAGRDEHLTRSRDALEVARPDVDGVLLGVGEG